MEEVVGGLRLALEEAEIATKPGDVVNIFYACWKRNRFRIGCNHGLIQVYILTHAKKSACRIVPEIVHKEFDLNDPKSIPVLVKYLKRSRKARE